MAERKIPDPERLKLWVRSGGRCQICRRSLLEGQLAYRRHEDRVSLVTSFGEYNRTTPIRMVGWLRGSPVEVGRDAVATTVMASAGRMPRFDLSTRNPQAPGFDLVDRLARPSGLPTALTGDNRCTRPKGTALTSSAPRHRMAPDLSLSVLPQGATAGAGALCDSTVTAEW